MRKRIGRKSKRRRSFWRRTGVAVIIILAALAVFFTVFRTEKVIVSGNTRYSDEDIRTICLDGALSNNTFLFAVFHKKIELADMPYLDHVDTEMIDRSTLHLSVDERIPAGRILFGGKMCYFDKKGTVIDIRSTEEDPDASALLVDGAHPEAGTIAVGDTVFADRDPLLSEVNALSLLLLQYGLTPDKVEIREDDTMTLLFGSLRISLGSDTFLEEKMARVNAIFDDLSGSAGILHLEDFTDSTRDIIFEEF